MTLPIPPKVIWTRIVLRIMIYVMNDYIRKEFGD